MERRCRASKERCKLKGGEREERGRGSKKRAQDKERRERWMRREKEEKCFFYSCISCCLYVLTTMNLGSEFTMSCQKTSEI